MNAPPRLTRADSRRGAIAILVLFMFVAMMTLGFLILKTSNVQRHMVAAQVASDSGSRWGVDALSRAETVAERNVAEAEVRDLVYRNYNVEFGNDASYHEHNLDTLDVNVVFGRSRPVGDSFDFVANALPLNAASVSISGDLDIVGPMEGMDGIVRISRESKSMALERDICLVIDRSGSMLFDLQTNNWMYDYNRHDYNKLSTSRSSRDRQNSWQWWHRWPHPTNSRWSTMIPAVYGLADELGKTNQKELFSIVSYSSPSSINFYDHDLSYRRFSYQVSETEVQPTRSYRDAAQQLETKYAYNKPVYGSTDISAGIDQAVSALTGPEARPNAFKTMILMTDGQQNRGRSSWLAAADAADRGIEIYTVTFGSGADQSAMQRTAAAANGKHFHAPNGNSLEEIFRAIANMPPSALIQ